MRDKERRRRRDPGNEYYLINALVLLLVGLVPVLRDEGEERVRAARE